MFSNFNIDRIRDFINRERMYVLMLSLILLFNVALIFPGSALLPERSFLGERAFSAGESSGEDIDTGFKELTKISEKALWERMLKNKKHIFAFVNILALLAVSVFSLGIFLDIRILMAGFKKRKLFQVKRRHILAKWGIRDVFKLAIIFVFLGYALQIIEAHLFSRISKGKGLLSFAPLLNTGIMDLAILGFIIYFVRVKYRQGLAAVGLKIKGALKFIFLALLSYIAFLPILAILLLLVIWLASVFNYQPPQQMLFKLFLEERRIWVLVYSTAMVVLLGPFVEEAFFRGFTYNAMKKRWGVKSAMVLSAVVFAGLHGNLIGFLPIMALGLLLAYMYEKTGSLVPSITIHTLHNAVMVGLLFLGRYFMRLFESG